MILTVRHTTIYRYDRPVRAVLQSHRLRPARFDGQRVIDWSAEPQGGIRGGGFRDGAGDFVQAWTIPGPVTEVAVEVRGTVETSDLAGVLRGYRERLPPEVWLRKTQATRCDAVLAALADDTAPDAAGLELAHALAHAVAGPLPYAPGQTQSQTTAAEAMAQGAGVCQDHAQVLIALARRRELPARYVAGYLLADANGRPHEAAHAWAEIWIAGLGWVGFDPANGCCPDARYIRLGSGLDAADAAPIRGIARGDADERLEVSVAVEAQQQ
jgi:transglutaminase-like putative cysteine protease